jgi:2-oxo-4-hydroxy-4-carboxy-5-ureidoimidazoline decarboxylase
MPLDDLNQSGPLRFFELIGGPLEGQQWLAEQVAPHRPFNSVQGLFEAFEAVVQTASQDEKIALIASHPDLAGRAAMAGEVSETSQREQAAAGLDRLTPEEYERFHALNDAYRARFGFPFVICARENTKESILKAFEQRLHNDRSTEITTGVAEVLKILRLRLLEKFG